MNRRIWFLLTATCVLHLALAAVACAQGDGTEDDPYLLDIDDLLKQGFAVVVTPEDTLTFEDAGTDTVRVQAPRLRVSEVVRRIGERMEQQSRDLGVHSLTSLYRVEIVDDLDDPRSKVTEIVGGERHHVDADGEVRSVRLFEHTRKWKDGELAKEESDTELQEQWSEQARESAMSLPFLLMSADRYKYTILERTLIGEHLVFRIGFEPRSRFEPGIAGEVWIDYSDFVIRRMEGRLAGASPAPMFLKDVPKFVWRQKQLADHWVTDSVYAEIRLTDLPFLPDEIALDMRLVNWTIDGVEYEEEER